MIHSYTMGIGIMPNVLEVWPRPIPVSERLPDSGDCVLVFCTNDAPLSIWMVAVYEDGVWSDGQRLDHENDQTLESVTHWLPMPPDPTLSDVHKEIVGRREPYPTVTTFTPHDPGS